MLHSAFYTYTLKNKKLNIEHVCKHVTCSDLCANMFDYTSHVPIDLREAASLTSYCICITPSIRNMGSGKHHMFYMFTGYMLACLGRSKTCNSILINIETCSNPESICNTFSNEAYM